VIFADTLDNAAGNAWVLEQMYMDGVPVDLPDVKDYMGALDW
jgi:hypothetical protein